MRLIGLTIGIAFVWATAPAVAQDWNCTDPQAQQEMNYCAGLEYERADKALNVLWPKVRASMKEQDAELKEYGPDLVGAEAALLKAQRAWIDYRDGQCESEGFEARGGSLEPLLVSTCLTRLTNQRIQELTLLMQEY
jgi:uncharacterized protein YecT (DUF1311 family)